MRTRYSIVFPIAAILSGVLLELNALGFAGNFLPADILLKAWPALLAFAGLDLLFSQRRMVGALVFLFSSAALFSAQLLGTGADNVLWQTFIKIWPILLILFGVDWIFSGNSVINTIVIIAGVIVLIFVLFTILDVPVIEKLPFKLDMNSVISTADFREQEASPKIQQAPPAQKPAPEKKPVENSVQMPDEPQPITVGKDGKITIAPPGMKQANLVLRPASGNISLKASGDDSQFVRGTIHLDPAEKLSHSTDFADSKAKYTLKSKGEAATADSSTWELEISSQKTSINAAANSGYIKADLRGLNLSSVSLQNKFGPVDVMLPQSTNAKIKITADDGDVRLYVPQGAAVNCTINSAGSVDYPQYSFNLNGITISSRRPNSQPIEVEINANTGNVQIIEGQ